MEGKVATNVFRKHIRRSVGFQCEEARYYNDQLVVRELGGVGQAIMMCKKRERTYQVHRTVDSLVGYAVYLQNGVEVAEIKWAVRLYSAEGMTQSFQGRWGLAIH